RGDPHLVTRDGGGERRLERPEGRRPARAVAAGRREGRDVEGLPEGGRREQRGEEEHGGRGGRRGEGLHCRDLRARNDGAGAATATTVVDRASGGLGRERRRESGTGRGRKRWNPPRTGSTATSGRCTTRCARSSR